MQQNQQVENLIKQNNELTTQVNQQIKINTQYQEVLEKTNNQLGLWTNPYSLMVGGLAVLFTVLTIVAAVMIWWQSRENREMVREELDKVINKQKQDALNEVTQHIKEKQNEINQVAESEKEGIKNEIKTYKAIELQLKTNSFDLSGYMKKEDYICDSCRLGSRSYLDWDIVLSRTTSFKTFSLNKKKCLVCKKEF